MPAATPAATADSDRYTSSSRTGGIRPSAGTRGLPLGPAMKRFASAAWLLLALAGCETAGHVAPPSQPPASASPSEKIFADSYERTWAALVAYATRSSFIIDSAAKDNGLLVFSFSGTPERYLDCGAFTSNQGQTSPTIQVIGRQADVRLDGRANVIVKVLDNNQTSVQVRTHYLYAAVSRDWSSTWSFDSGQSATQPAGQFHHEVTCRPTGALESAILSGVETELAAVASAAYWIQLAAAKSEAEAQTLWTRIQARHRDVLGTLALRVGRVDLGAQGIFYRVQAGPFADKGAAQSACSKLKAKKQACIVRP
jgi:SPOR domain